MKILPLADAYFFTLIAIRVNAETLKAMEYCWKIRKRLLARFKRNASRFLNGTMLRNIELCSFINICQQLKHRFAQFCVMRDR